MNEETPMTKLPDGSGCFTATILSNEEALALPLKERPINHRISSEMYHSVFEHIGEASMAWSPNTGSAVFNSEMASDVATRLCFKIADEVEKATEELRDEVELKNACINGMRNTGVKAWNSAIDSVLALYVPDGNPYVWRRKIEGLRQNENMPELVKEPDSMGVCPTCGANTDSWHFCQDYGAWR